MYESNYITYFCGNGTQFKYMLNSPLFLAEQLLYYHVDPLQICGQNRIIIIVLSQRDASHSSSQVISSAQYWVVSDNSSVLKKAFLFISLEY